MRSLETPACGERSLYSRCAVGLWIAIRTTVIFAGVCWLLLNAAIFTGYMRTADPFAVFTFEPLSGTSSSSQHGSGGSSNSVTVTSNVRMRDSGEIRGSNSNREEQQEYQQGLLTSGTGARSAPGEPSQTAADHRLEYVAVGKIKPNENGEYEGAKPDRMHGNLGLYHDGTPAYIPAPPPPMGTTVQELLSRGGGFNVLLSDHLPLDRDAVDSRTSSCKQQQHEIGKLPKASVVIIFFNEPFSTLLRSVHSILNLTPPQLLEEIILVDDGSNLDYIGGSGPFETVTAAGPGGSVEGGSQFVAAELFDNEAAALQYGSDEAEEEHGRRLALLRSKYQHPQQQPLPGSPNYRSKPTLEEYLELLPEKVKLLRNKERKGIVGARMYGIRATKAPVFIILDSHIEVQPQWIEPLLLRIAADRRRIVMPQIDGIEADTFEYVGAGIGCKLGFLWKLMEHSYEPHQLARAAASKPVNALLSPAPANAVTGLAGFAKGGRAVGDTLTKEVDTAPGSTETSPVMAGGLFAAEKLFFFQIGAYDEAFQYWGTENLELSFRLWQCGGVLECAPCSRVYHIFRKGGMGYSLPPHAVTVNKMRTLLWMDQYADLAWRVLGKPRVDFGWESLQQRRKWREEHKCKSFEWFLHNVYPEGDVLDLRDVPYLGRSKTRQKHRWRCQV